MCVFSQCSVMTFMHPPLPQLSLFFNIRHLSAKLHLQQTFTKHIMYLPLVMSVWEKHLRGPGCTFIFPHIRWNKALFGDDKSVKVFRVSLQRCGLKLHDSDMSHKWLLTWQNLKTTCNSTWTLTPMICDVIWTWSFLLKTLDTLSGSKIKKYVI